jgi:hypothetical protein
MIDFLLEVFAGLIPLRVVLLLIAMAACVWAAVIFFRV